MSGDVIIAAERQHRRTPPTWLAWLSPLATVAAIVAAGVVWLLGAGEAKGSTATRLMMVETKAQGASDMATAAQTTAESLKSRVYNAEWNSWRACVAAGDKLCREPEGK